MSCCERPCWRGGRKERRAARSIHLADPGGERDSSDDAADRDASKHEPPRARVRGALLERTLVSAAQPLRRARSVGAHLVDTEREASPNSSSSHPEAPPAQWEASGGGALSGHCGRGLLVIVKVYYYY